jgi:hypothetical protein
MSAERAFDIDTIMREVRAAAKRPCPATTGTLLQNSPNRSDVAVVATWPVPEIEERAGLADGVPSGHLDAWAPAQEQDGVAEGDWRRERLFLDEFGNEAAKSGWRPTVLFDVGANQTFFSSRPCHF